MKRWLHHLQPSSLANLFSHLNPLSFFESFFEDDNPFKRVEKRN